MHSNYKVLVILGIFGNPKQLLQVYLKKKGKINKRSHFFSLAYLEKISYSQSQNSQKWYFLLQQNLSIMCTYLLSCILNTPNVFKMANQCRFIFSSFLENGEFILENYFKIHSREFSRNQFSRSITRIDRHYYTRILLNIGTEHFLIFFFKPYIRTYQ